MSQLLPVSRAARLVGISRGEIQARIRRNELPTFEGMVRVSDLLRTFPETRLVDDSAIERTERIKANASPRTDVGGKLPSAEVLARRVTELSRDLTEARDETHHFTNLLNELGERIDGLRQAKTPPSTEELESLYQWLQEGIAHKPMIPRRKKELMAQDTFLRMVEAQVKLVPSGDEYFVQGTDTLLESGLRSGIALRYGCTQGSCSKCKARIVSGDVLRVRDHEYKLSENEHNLGYILMCSYTAVTDLVIEADVARESSDIPLQKIKADVSSFKRANDSIAILRLKTPGNFLLRFLAGQAFLLTLPGGEHEVFPVASCPCDGNQLEFHINTRKDGAISGYISNNSPETGTSVVMHGPLGDFVLHTDSSRPLLLVAINEGFAQIKSLIESAVSIDKAEHFHLFWVTDKPDMNYMDNLCRSWADSLDNFDYTPLDCSAITECEQLVDMLKNNMKDIPDMKDHDIYVSAPRVILDTLVSRLHSMGVEDAHINCFDLDSLYSLKSPETPKIVIEQAGNNVGQS